MVVLKSFWAPYIWHPPFIWNIDVKAGCRYCAAYTIVLSIIIMTTTIYLMAGGEIIQPDSPMSEMDDRNSLLWDGALNILYSLCWIIASVYMLMGINKMHRGMILPWLILMGICCASQAFVGIWLLRGYYTDNEVTLFIWAWMGYNIYCWLCVYSQYQIISELQTPNIELLYP